MTSPMTPPATYQPHRQLKVDALKAVASQLIVWHHLSAYGPLSEQAHLLWPDLMGWLYGYARMAVQVFLVVGGYLAWRHLDRRVSASGWGPLGLWWRRYLRLTAPLLVALVLTGLAAWWARAWLDDTFVPSAPSWAQWFAHALLLHDVVDQEALSAGVWYVAIDFQLYAGLALLVWLGRQLNRPLLVWALVAVATLASLLVFNRYADWDAWALYFFGAYGLGVLARWVESLERRHWGLLLIGLVGALALWVDYRTRIGLAVAVALVLAWPGHWQVLHPTHETLAWLGRTSYGLFLLHFAWLLVGNTLFERWLTPTPLAALGAMLGVWLLSMVSAHWFEKWVERPLGRRLG